MVLIEIADLVFAVDSVLAVFTITTDPYIVYTSNIFAILGLRALYFALAAILHRFAYLKYALSVLLIFIGSKIFVADLMGWEKFPPLGRSALPSRSWAPESVSLFGKPEQARGKWFQPSSQKTILDHVPRASSGVPAFE